MRDHAQAFQRRGVRKEEEERIEGGGGGRKTRTKGKGGAYSSNRDNISRFPTQGNFWRQRLKAP